MAGCGSSESDGGGNGGTAAHAGTGGIAGSAGVGAGAAAGVGAAGGAGGGGAGAGGAAGSSSQCAPFGFTCGVSPHPPTCCEGTCRSEYNACCNLEDEPCDPNAKPLAHGGCCPGRFCDAQTSKCVAATCYPSAAPGSGEGACDQLGFPPLPCCDAGFVCDEDPIYGKRCCAPSGTSLPNAQSWACCSGSFEQQGDSVKCLP
jgi:hypothetical protein